MNSELKVRCENCIPKDGVELPNFSDNQKRDLVLTKRSHTIRVIKKLRNDFQLKNVEAKYIGIHITMNHGECHKCLSNIGNCENINCENCGALNYNWLI